MAKKTEKIVFRTEEWLKVALEDLADQHEITVGELIRNVLARSVRARVTSSKPQQPFPAPKVSEPNFYV